MSEAVGASDPGSRVGGSEATKDAPDSKALDTKDLKAISGAADAVPSTDLSKAGLDVAGELSTDGIDRVAEKDPAQKLAENPAGFLADPSKAPQQLQDQLKGLSTPQLTDTIKGIDQPEMGYGSKVTPEGWKALNGEIDRRFTDALKNREFNQDLAQLSQEAVRQPGLNKSLAEKNWREIAPGFVDRSAPEAQEMLRTLDKTTRMRNAYINGGLNPEDMTNGELLQKVGDIPGMRTASDVIGLAGVPGMLASAMGEAKIQDRLAELDKRIADGRLPPTAVDPGTGSPLARTAGTAVAVAQVASALNPRSWLSKGAKALFGGAKMTASEAKISGVLRDALAKKGNFGLGSLTRSEALKAGEAWVGPGFKRAVGTKGETILTSADGTRRYRDFTTKVGQYPGVQANLESLRLGPAFKGLERRSNWSVNGHIDLAPDPSWFQRLSPF